MCFACSSTCGEWQSKKVQSAARHQSQKTGSVLHAHMCSLTNGTNKKSRGFLVCKLKTVELLDRSLVNTNPMRWLLYKQRYDGAYKC